MVFHQLYPKSYVMGGKSWWMREKAAVPTYAHQLCDLSPKLYLSQGSARVFVLMASVTDGAM